MKLSSQFSWDKDSYSVRCCDIVIIIVNNIILDAQKTPKFILFHTCMHVLCIP